MRPCGEAPLFERLVPGGDETLFGFKEFHGRIYDFDGFDGIALLHRVDDIDAGGDFTEDGVFAVQVRGWTVRYEELASVAVRAGVGHGEDTWLVVLEGLADFVGKPVVGPAEASASGVATLDHEIFDDAVEGDSVVEAPLGKVQEVGCGDGNFRSEDRCFNCTTGCFEDDTDVFHLPRCTQKNGRGESLRAGRWLWKLVSL